MPWCDNQMWLTRLILLVFEERYTSVKGGNVGQHYGIVREATTRVLTFNGGAGLSPVSLLIWFPANVPGKHQEMAQVWGASASI